MEKANPKLASLKDEDERLPIHWAVSYNHIPIVEMLVQAKSFDPDVKVQLKSSHVQAIAHSCSGRPRLDTLNDGGEP